MMPSYNRGAVVASLLVTVLALSGCGSKVANRAPVEDRGTPTASSTPLPAAAEPVAPAVRQPAGFENAGKPGFYTVKPGDTLIRIGLDSGQSWRDIARWNGLDNPNVIEIGQVLRVVPPAVPATTVVGPGVVTRPVASATVTTAPVAPAQTTAPASTVAAPAPAPVAAPAATPAVDEDVTWIWPARGTVLSGFDEVKNKGVDIAGVAGDPVLAAADGRVVYVGASLRGYGNLVILKHNNTYLTAYAHNQLLLVKEDQTVRRGQKIAEMGSSDADRVKLHFEVRRQGKPVDPTKYLPAR